MSTQLESLLRSFRDLPYNDMMLVAGVVASALGDSRSDSVVRVAAALGGLRAELVDEATEFSREDKAVRELMGRRRALLTYLKPLPKGWLVSIPEVPAASAQAPELRVAFAHMLDQAIAAYLMLK